MLAKAPNDSASVLADAIRSACIKRLCWRTTTQASVACVTRDVGSVRLPRYVISICVG